MEPLTDMTFGTTRQYFISSQKVKIATFTYLIAGPIFWFFIIYFSYREHPLLLFFVSELPSKCEIIN